MCRPVSQNFESTSTPHVVAAAPFTVQQVVKRLKKKNAERAAALQQYEVTRVYSMQYRGFPSDRSAEMIVEYGLSRSEFKAVQRGVAKRIKIHYRSCFQETARGRTRGRQRRKPAAKRSDNGQLRFHLVAYENSADGGLYVLNLSTPRTNNKFLYGERSGSMRRILR